MWPCSVSQHTNANIKTYKYKDVEIQMRKCRNTKSIAGQSALVGVDDGKDWTWNAALAQGSADLIQGLGLQHRGVGTLYKAQGCTQGYTRHRGVGTLYKAGVQFIQYSIREALGRTDRCGTGGGLGFQQKDSDAGAVAIFYH